MGCIAAGGKAERKAARRRLLSPPTEAAIQGAGSGEGGGRAGGARAEGSAGFGPSGRRSQNVPLRPSVQREP